MAKYFKYIDIKVAEGEDKVNQIEQAVEEELREQKGETHSHEVEFEHQHLENELPTYTRHQLRDKLVEEQEMCYNNLIKFYKSKDKDVEAVIKNILNSRKTIPETTQFAIKVKISNINSAEK